MPRSSNGFFPLESCYSVMGRVVSQGSYGTLQLPHEVSTKTQRGTTDVTDGDSSVTVMIRCQLLAIDSDFT